MRHHIIFNSLVRLLLLVLAGLASHSFGWIAGILFIIVGIIVFSPYWEAFLYTLFFDMVTRPETFVVPLLTLGAALVIATQIIIISRAYRPRLKRYML